MREAAVWDSGGSVRYSGSPNRGRDCTDMTTANQFAPKLRPTRCFSKLDRKTFSQVIQFRTRHAHISEYYHWFGITMESRGCQCGKPSQTRNHILTECPQMSRHRHLLRRGKQTRFDILAAKVKGGGGGKTRSIHQEDRQQTQT
jgi:hypothetical protein